MTFKWEFYPFFMTYLQMFVSIYLTLWDKQPHQSFLNKSASLFIFKRWTNVFKNDKKDQNCFVLFLQAHYIWQNLGWKSDHLLQQVNAGNQDIPKRFSCHCPWARITSLTALIQVISWCFFWTWNFKTYLDTPPFFQPGNAPGFILTVAN